MKGGDHCEGGGRGIPCHICLFVIILACFSLHKGYFSLFSLNKGWISCDIYRNL
jgi:hypothetical protein